MADEQKRAIFRTKSAILTARDLGHVKIADDVVQKAEFISAKMTDLLGLIVTPGSDYTCLLYTSPSPRD